jgi:hypothetical protein
LAQTTAHITVDFAKFAPYPSPAHDVAYIWADPDPLIWINLEGEPSGYAETPDNWIFLCK